MNCETTNPVNGVDRRSVLAAGAAGLSLSMSGCIDTVRSVVDGDGDDQLSLSILTVPADGDRESVRIARHLESKLKAVGIDATLAMRSRSEFLEAILIDHEFDLYVGRHPADFDPDFLYEALHSTYATEAGWQNPYGFANLAFDSLLEDQRRADSDERSEYVASVLRAFADEKPFDPICRPDEYRVARTDRFEGWDDGHLATRRGYLGLEPVDESVEQLHALVTDARPSKNLNPLSATARERGTVIDLLYDSLGTLDDGEVTPWLAREWEWNRPSSTDDSDRLEDVPADGSTSTVTVSLREDCRFHDGEPVTAADVAFTYRFLRDTALGRATAPSPAPRYRGPVGAIEGIDVEDDYRLRLSVDASPEVGKRAFTVPILPRHIWHEALEERIDTATEFMAPQGQWELVTTSSIEPIGSGPYQFDSRSEREHVTFRRFDDHFTRRDDVDLPEAHTEELRFTVDPGSPSSISRVESGDADVTASMLEAYSIDDIPDDPDITRLESASRTFYHLGFNTRKAPCSNPHFRRAVAQLIDKQWIVEEIFSGHADPLTVPVADEWVPVELQWDGEDPVTPFVGSDNSLNVEAARDAFEAAGYPYDDDGNMLRRY